MKLKLFWINLGIGQKVTKSNKDPSILRALSLEVLNILYHEPESLRIFADGSLLSDSPNAGAGVFSEIISFYVSMDRGTAFVSEIAAIHTALFQPQCHLETITRAVILSDSKAALLAIFSDNNHITPDLLDYRHASYLMLPNLYLISSEQSSL
ncbi:hypothetical protein TNIN_265891 [Trichonephila inaurata madagascariensis]|uniref:Uncharacterized protein n=1 Tax=Trichonephila inaurata madagascariensis TaxID=2747483 RepID=A0A8X7CKC1_9ARAC|nr:hypothetical protein TNIN_265891 [Trichonephila inaurata madagascariensis]